MLIFYWLKYELFDSVMCIRSKENNTCQLKATEDNRIISPAYLICFNIFIALIVQFVQIINHLKNVVEN